MTTLIYPGYKPLFVKRLWHVAVLSCITLNVYLQKLENLMVQTSINLVEDVSRFAPEARTITNVMDPAIRALRAVEGSRFHAMSKAVDLPSADTLASYRDSALRIARHQSHMAPMMRHGAIALNLLSVLGWITIAYSALWMVLDVRYGGARLWSVVLLGLVVWVNYKVWAVLDHMWLAYGFGQI